MNKKGNIMLSILFFIMALGVLVAFVNPLNQMIDLMQQSDSLNCKGFIFDGDSTHTLSFNSSKNNNASSSPLACLSLKLYLPYILLVFLIGGITAVLGNRAGEMFGFDTGQQFG
jgi:hypothetical protein|tara:strand:- start:8261 stop:8602 length:342 start_codon:yes stop_codon:yes gene_type:complete